MKQRGLRLDQAPPIAVPLAFFLTVPAMTLLAGTLLAWSSESTLVSTWLPQTLALTHLGTLGVLTMAMCGALYQMIPVVAGAPVPWVRLGHAVHALLTVGTWALVAGLWRGQPAWVAAGALGLSAAVVLFGLPIAAALFLRTPVRSPTVLGMRLAVACLAVLVGLGVRMAWQHVTGDFASARAMWLQVHVSLGLLGWVGGLVTAVSWQVVPMFYLARAVPDRAARTVLGLLAAGVVLVLAAPWLGEAVAPGLSPSTLFGLCALPAVVAVWLLAPWLTWQALRARRRRRKDPSLLFWQVSLVTAPLCAIAGVFAVAGVDGRWPLALGWLAAWGWAGLLVHGMLTRIVPFMVWFHRFSPLVGIKSVPPMARLWPGPIVRIGLGLHLAGLLTGLLAIALQNAWLTRATGGLCAATGLVVAWGMLGCVGTRAASQPDRMRDGAVAGVTEA